MVEAKKKRDADALRKKRIETASLWVGVTLFASYLLWIGVLFTLAALAVRWLWIHI
jgi:hypothetical protein